MRAGARGGRGPRPLPPNASSASSERAPRGLDPLRPQPLGELGLDRGAMAAAGRDRGLAARGQRDAARAPVGGIGLAPHVAAPLEVGDRLRRRLLADAEPLRERADRPRAGHEVLEDDAVGQAQVVEPVGRDPPLHLVGERPAGEQGREREVGVGGSHRHDLFNHGCGSVVLCTTMVVETLAPPAVAEAFIAIAHRVVWCSLATVDRRGRPRSRLVHPIWEPTDDGLVGWLTSRPTPLRRAHLAATPFVSCSYWDPAHDVAVAECARRVGRPTRDQARARLGVLPRRAAARSATTPRRSGPPARTIPDAGVIRLDPWRLQGRRRRDARRGRRAARLWRRGLGRRGCASLWWRSCSGGAPCSSQLPSSRREIAPRARQLARARRDRRAVRADEVGEPLVAERQRHDDARRASTRPQRSARCQSVSSSRSSTRW